jgi:hypothetical protein
MLKVGEEDFCYDPPIDFRPIAPGSASTGVWLFGSSITGNGEEVES